MNTALKPSRFNCFTKDENENLVVCNSLTGRMCIIHKKYADEFLRYLKGEQEIPGNIRQTFLKINYFLRADADELALYKSACNRYYDSPILELSILPTHQCNCRCVYCYEDFQSGILSEADQEALVRFVKIQMRRCSSLHVGWFGGEPLVAMDVIRNLSKKFMAICKAMHKPYSASITTNGTLLTCDIFSELQNYGVISYQITIDGMKDVHDVQRPLVGKGSSYDMIMRNLKEIKARTQARTFNVYLRINLTKRSFSEIEAYLGELNEGFGGDARFPVTICMAADWGGDRIADYKENLFEEDDRYYDVRKSIYRLIRDKHYDLSVSGVGGRYLGMLSLNTGCYVNKKNFYTIDHDGTVYKCAQQIRQNFPPLGKLQDFDGPEDFLLEQSKWESVIYPVIPEKCENCRLLPLGCWGASACPLAKFAAKYHVVSPEQAAALCDENTENKPVGRDDPKEKKICFLEKYDLDTVLRMAAQEFEGAVIDKIYEEGKRNL